MKLVDLFGVFIGYYKKKKTEEIRESLASIGKDSTISYPAILGVAEKIYIGNNTTIFENSRLCVYHNGCNNNVSIKIGNGCYILRNFTILAGADVEISDNVLIADDVTITSENHMFDPEKAVPYKEQPLSVKDVYIGENTWIGEKVIILPGVKIGKGCVIGGVPL